MGTVNCRHLYVLAVLALMVFCWLWGYGTGSTHVPPTHDTVLITRDSIKIDSFIIENNKIKDSLIYVDKTYNETVDSLVNASDSANYEYFREYLQNHQRRTKGN